MSNKTEMTEADEATATERWLDELDPTDPAVKVRDGRYLRHIGEAAAAAETADAQLREAVAEARAHGETWGLIGMVLGITRQAAQQRFKDADTKH